MKSFDDTKASLSIMSALVTKLVVDKKRCKDGMTEELYATEEAYQLMKSGVPFRDAYKKVEKEYT